MRRPGALALAVMVLCAPATVPGKKQRKREVIHTSPDLLHVAQVTPRGRVKLDGQHVRCGPGRVVGKLTWRQDSRALAFLQRSPHGLQLVVLPRLDPRHPLAWHLPSTASAMRAVFWITHTQLGVGDREPVPRLVVSWTTSDRLW